MVRALALASLAVSSGALAAEIRLDDLGGRPHDRILLFISRGEGVDTPVVAFQERARRVIEDHLHARVISMEEAFVRGGSDFQRRLAECRGDDGCYARLVGSVDASHLLVVSASKLGDVDVVASRFIDLERAKALGDAADAVPEGTDMLAVVPDRIRASIPPDLWDPFGSLRLTVDRDGAELSVEGRVVGVAPIDRIGHILPGRYRVRATKAGYVPAEATVDVERGKEASATLSLEEESSSKWWLWTLLGVAAAAGVATAIALTVGGGGGSPEFCSSPDPAACPGN